MASKKLCDAGKGCEFKWAMWGKKEIGNGGKEFECKLFVVAKMWE
jgi:hypothetical protein